MLPGLYRMHRGRTPDRVRNVLEQYFTICDATEIGEITENKIVIDGVLFAHYYWERNTDIPYFIFESQSDWWIQRVYKPFLDQMPIIRRTFLLWAITEAAKGAKIIPLLQTHCKAIPAKFYPHIAECVRVYKHEWSYVCATQ